MRKIVSGLTILLLATSLACNNTKENQPNRAGQSSKDEATKGNPANTPAGGRNTSTGNPAVDRTNQPTNPGSGSGSSSNLAGTGTADNGTNPAPNDSTRPHKKANEAQSATAPK